MDSVWRTVQRTCLALCHLVSMSNNSGRRNLFPKNFAGFDKKQGRTSQFLSFSANWAFHFGQSYKVDAHMLDLFWPFKLCKFATTFTMMELLVGFNPWSSSNNVTCRQTQMSDEITLASKHRLDLAWGTAGSRWRCCGGCCCPRSACCATAA